MAKKKFRVWAKSIGYCCIEIEAKSKEEAEEIGKNIDGGDFEEDEEMGEWEIVDTMTTEVT